MQALVSPVLPAIQHDVHSSPTTTSWLLTGTLLTSSVSTPVFSRLSDMFGKRRLYLLACTFLGTGILLAATASSIGTLIAARTLQGLGGAMFPIAASLIRDRFPPHRVSHGIAGLSGLFATSGAIGIVVAGPITERLDYHWLFWVAMAFALAAVTAGALVLEETPIVAGSSVDWQGALLLGTGLTTLLVGVTRAPHWGWTSGRVGALLATAVVALLAWARVERRVHEPLVDLQMLRRRHILVANAVTALSGYAIFAVFLFLPLLVELPRQAHAGAGFGSSVTVAGLFLLPANLGMLVASPVSGRLSQAGGSRRPLVLGGLLMTVGLGAYSASHASVAAICVTLTVFGCGVGFAYASALDLTLMGVRPHETAIAAGMNSISRQVGGSIGAAVTASILASSLQSSGEPSAAAFTAVAIVGAAVSAVALAAGFLLQPRAGDLTLPAPLEP